jgi:hypothetical protein
MLMGSQEYSMHDLSFLALHYKYAQEDYALMRTDVLY